jgi:hypothetical protein
MSEIQECYWLIPLLKVEYSRKGFGIITRSTIVLFTAKVLFVKRQIKQKPVLRMA